MEYLKPDFDFDKHELKKIERMLIRLGPEIAKRESRIAVLVASRMIAKTAKEILEPYRDTGELIKSVRARAYSNSRQRVTVGKISISRRTNYGYFLEFGNSRQAGIHWLSQSLVLNQKRVVPRMAQYLKQRMPHIARK